MVHPPRSAIATLLTRLDSPATWPQAAAELVAELGFRLAGEGVDPPDDGHLVVALRDVPTMRHFDPESIAFYGPDAKGAAVATVGRLQPGQGCERPVLWGHVHVVDRIPVENRFLTFGGRLRMAGLEGGLTVAHLSSPVPIVRWGGHSQGTDSLAGAIGAFFGRLIVRVDYMPGAAALINAASPAALFLAFLLDEARRRASALARGVAAFELDHWLQCAWIRWREHEPARSDAERLLGELDL
jgi:hypothetical protein